MKPKLPFVAGFEISGEVLEIAPKRKHSDGNDSEDDDELCVGDRVLAINKTFLSGFSTECVADHKVKLWVNLLSSINVNNDFVHVIQKFDFDIQYFC